MKTKSFTELLQQATYGDMDAIDKILRLYEPLINHHCMISDKYDEDCRQYIMLNLVKRIAKFKI